MINAGARGYYRSSYSAGALGGISLVAQAQFSPAERLMLLVDGWSMVRSGKLDIGDFLSVLEGYKSERQGDVMARVGAILRDIDVDLAPGKESEPYRAWVRNLLRPAAKGLGWSPAPGESDDRRSLRSTVIYTLGSVGRDPEILQKSRALIEEYMQDPSTIDPSLATTVARLAALQGDQALYEKYLAYLKSAKTPEEYDRFLYSLAGFSHPDLLIRTIEYALSGGVRIQNAPFLIGAVLQNPAGRPATWNYFKQHWAAVSLHLPPFAAGPLVESAGAVCDAVSREDVESFFAANKLPAAERTMRQTDEVMNQCIDLRSQQESKLANWLEGHAAAKSQ
jgi:aminopeptidase N